mmetsp:Transcript_76828/g.225518  ORF Transcript_76828/g.225518 Transcript_76828/m.225518 type:complete len:200 (-) Transcript_76828:231-830(-)
MMLVGRRPFLHHKLGQRQARRHQVASGPGELSRNDPVVAVLEVGHAARAVQGRASNLLGGRVEGLHDVPGGGAALPVRVGQEDGLRDAGPKLHALELLSHRRQPPDRMTVVCHNHDELGPAVLLETERLHDICTVVVHLRAPNVLHAASHRPGNGMPSLFVVIEHCDIKRVLPKAVGPAADVLGLAKVWQARGQELVVT